MGRRLRRLGNRAIGMSALLLLGPTLARATPVEAPARAQLASLPMPFVANQGQVDARVAFYAPTLDATLFVTRGGDLVYSLPAPPAGPSRGPRSTSSRPGWTLTETLRGGRVRTAGQTPSATGVSSFLGDDPARWRRSLPAYEQISLGEVWPGVTVSLRAQGRNFEKVFTLAPHASAARIRLSVSGAKALAVDASGALIARTGLGPVTFTAPVAYQEHEGVRR